MKACDLKNGSVVNLDGAPHMVEAIRIQTPSARGGASLYKIRFRNVQSGQKRDETCKGDDMFKDTELQRKTVQYLYREGDRFTFMDLDDYTQFELNKETIEAQIPYLLEDMEDIQALIVDGRPVGISMPPTVDLPIVECDPSIRGASATARTKPATCSTGLIVQVPEYLSPDETIRVDTRTGEFLSRA